MGDALMSNIMEIKKMLKWRNIPAKFKSIARKNLNLIITGVETNQKVVALTFNDGPHPEYTPRILDLLDQYGAKATFFTVGGDARKHYSIIRRIRSAGHAIGNHTYSHKPMPLISRSERFRQIQNTQRLIQQNEKLFRPPWGFIDWPGYVDVKLLGFKVVYWEAAVYDWRNSSPDEIFQRLDKNVRSGSIVLMYDNLRDSIGEDIRLDNLIEGLECYLQKYASHYRFVTVPQLLTLGAPRYTYGLHRKDEKDALIPEDML